MNAIFTKKCEYCAIVLFFHWKQWNVSVSYLTSGHEEVRGVAGHHFYPKNYKGTNNLFIA
jgi:hypothetical protein